MRRFAPEIMPNLEMKRFYLKYSVACTRTQRGSNERKDGAIYSKSWTGCAKTRHINNGREGSVRLGAAEPARCSVKATDRRATTEAPQHTEHTSEMRWRISVALDCVNLLLCTMSLKPTLPLPLRHKRIHTAASKYPAVVGDNLGQRQNVASEAIHRPARIRHPYTHAHAHTSTPKPSCLLLSIASFEDVASGFRCLLRLRPENEKDKVRSKTDQHSLPRAYHRPRALAGSGALPSRCPCLLGASKPFQSL